jgi:hypothetical protein
LVAISGVLRHVKYNGEPLVKGKRVTGLRMARRRGAAHQVVPFQVEDELLSPEPSLQPQLAAVFHRGWPPCHWAESRFIDLRSQDLLKLVG